MSILIRAALLGGLAYVVSRAVKSSHGSDYFAQSGTRRLSRDDYDQDETWPTSEKHSTGNL